MYPSPPHPHPCLYEQKLVIYSENSEHMATYSEGLNAVKILDPSNWITANSRDGSRIAFPPGWTSTEGREGKREFYIHELDFYHRLQFCP